MQKEFRRKACHFLEEFVNFMLSTVAAGWSIGQGVSCFCPTMLTGEDNHATLKLFGLLLDGILDKVLLKDSEVEACPAEYQSFMQKQRQFGLVFNEKPPQRRESSDILLSASWFLCSPSFE